MSWWKKHVKQKPDEVIEARTLREMAETCDWTANIRANPPLAIQAGPWGPLLRLAGMLFSIYVAISTTSIGYRVSGTPGSGTAKLLTWNGSTLVDLPGPVTRTVYNISSNAAGIASGKYMIIIRIAGDYWIITSEC